MRPEKVLSGSYILIVDDNQNVLDTFAESLDMCRIDTTTSFSMAKKLLEQNPYDIVVFDFMGMDGYELFKVAYNQGIPAVMPTVPARSKNNLKRSALVGTAFYAPNNMMAEITTFLADVLQAVDKGKGPWTRMAGRLGRSHAKKVRVTGLGGQKKDLFYLRPAKSLNAADVRHAHFFY